MEFAGSGSVPLKSCCISVCKFGPSGTFAGGSGRFGQTVGPVAHPLKSISKQTSKFAFRILGLLLVGGYVGVPCFFNLGGGLLRLDQFGVVFGVTHVAIGGHAAAKGHSKRG